MKSVNFLILTIAFFLTVSFNSVAGIVYSNIFLLILYLFFTLFTQNNFIRLFHVWIISVLYIIIPEGLLFSELNNNDAYIISACKFIFLSNLMVLFIHNLFYKESNLNIGPPKLYKSGWGNIFILVCFYIIFLSVGIPKAVQISNYGRVGASALNFPILYLSIANSAGLILPSIIAFTLKYIFKETQNGIKSFLLSMPIFLILFLGGTRFPLLFSFGGMLIVLVSENKFNLKAILKYSPILFALLLGSRIMVNYRAFGLKDGLLNLIYYTFIDQFYGKSLFASIEGIIYQTSVMIKYFESHSHLFGFSNAYIFYFWIPRSLWPDKPQMLGYWLMREAKGTSGFSEGHSFSFGFMGDAYADFGFLGGLIFCAFLGYFLARIENFSTRIFTSKNRYTLVLIALTYSYIFFFVRSPLTATFNFVGILLIFLFTRLTLKGFFISTTKISEES